MDVAALFDIDLSRRGRLPDLSGLLDGSRTSRTYERYDDSFMWLFEPQSTPGDDDSRATDPTARLLSQEVNCANSPPGFDRFALLPDPNDPRDQGGVITLSATLQAGMLCIWTSHPGTCDPLEIKLGLSERIPVHYLAQLAPLFEYISEGQLMYPFIGLRYDREQVAEVVRDDGVLLGHVLSGGLDHESDSTMRQYVAISLSPRRYEGLYLLASGGLGVYSSGVERGEDEDRDLYEKTFFRAVQVCEMCLIEQRLLRTFKTQTDADAGKVRLVPRPLLIEKRREELLLLENSMVKSLPFRTPESTPLVKRAQLIFGVPEFLQDAKDSYDFLEKRYQNTKTTAPAAVAVLTYVLDKLSFWAGLKGLVSKLHWH